MHIETVTDSPGDTEVCVSCPFCNFSGYMDPRPLYTPWNQEPGSYATCSGYPEHWRQLNMPEVCPACKEWSEVTGDTVWGRMLKGSSDHKTVWDQTKLPEGGNMERVLHRKGAVEDETNYLIVWEWTEDDGRKKVGYFRADTLECVAVRYPLPKPSSA